MEAELVRDNLLYVGGNLDLTMGGPEIDHKLGLTSKRRSVYLRTAAEKEVEFLKLFDNASVTECYMRKPSVMPQQALALANSELALNQAQALSQKLLIESARDPEKFMTLAFAKILARPPTIDEATLCREFLLKQRKRPAPDAVSSAGTPKAFGAELISAGASTPSTLALDPLSARDLILVLFNHNDFVSIR